MPAEKGIPKPKASARRLDVRNYDSREASGWLSERARSKHLNYTGCGPK